jgi:hypothetical protein
MKRLAIALFEQALADAVSNQADVREMARAFLFGRGQEMSCLREHWLRQAGLPLDAFVRLGRLSHEDLRERLRKTRPGPGEEGRMMVRRKGTRTPCRRMANGSLNEEMTALSVHVALP